MFALLGERHAKRTAYDLDAVSCQPLAQLRGQPLNALRVQTQQLKIEPEIAVVAGFESEVALPRQQT